MERDEWLALAEKLEAASRAGRTCRITPDTALRLAVAARARAAQPTRNELALAYCARNSRDRCAVPCTGCIGKANVADALYTGRTW